ncbi:MAG: AbrB/MazE/SpoVT family DNA-binding domain-containing protein [Chitinophagales bacterium]|nr:AbrB/MazE/SpoVT family DNA-binding domain-containing protein [Chitinophagales bacterium]
MEYATLNTKGQIVIPGKLRKKYGLLAGHKVALIEENDRLVLKALNKSHYESLIGTLKGKDSLTAALLKEKKLEKQR